MKKTLRRRFINKADQTFHINVARLRVFIPKLLRTLHLEIRFFVTHGVRHGGLWFLKKAARFD